MIDDIERRNVERPPEVRRRRDACSLEVPTPCWITYDTASFGVAPPKGLEPTHQECVDTSPVRDTAQGWP